MMPPGEARGGVNAAAEEAEGPADILRIIQVIGYEPLGTPVRRSSVYTISAINPGGDDGRVVIDARTGRIIGFVPAAVSNDEVEGTYGPPQLSPTVANASPAKIHMWTALRPPLPMPSGAERISAAPSRKPERRMAGIIASPSHAAAQSKASEAKGVIDNKRAETEPVVQLQPTQDMPAMQALD